MRGRDVILVMLVVVAVGALSMVGLWVGSFDGAGTPSGGATIESGGAGSAPRASGEPDDGERTAAAMTAAPTPPDAEAALSDGENPEQRAAARIQSGAGPTGEPVVVQAPETKAADPKAPEATAPEAKALGQTARAGGGVTVADVTPDIDRSTARVDVNDPSSFPEEPGRSFIDLDTNRPDDAVDLKTFESAGLKTPRSDREEGGAEADKAPEGAAIAELRKVPEDALREVVRDPEAAEFVKPARTPSGADKEGADVDDRPSFDLVRIEPDGSGVAAGRAKPFSFVTVIVDGELSEEVRADSRGEFVALIAPPKQGQLTRRIDLEMRTPEGVTLKSEAPVIVTLPSEPGAAPLVIQPQEDGVSLMQPTAKVDKGRVTIDAVSYGEEGEVVIAGRGGPGQTTRVYLDNSLSAEARVNPDGEWRVKIAKEVKPAVYRLRVDQMTTEGIVTSRAETPFERAAVENIKLRKGSVVVQPGNNLWRIADFVYGDGLRYTVIYKENKEQIRDPDLIYPGQIFQLPESAAAN